jgi:hypothetical protein
MENNSPIEGQIRRQKKVEEAQGVEHPRLDGGEERQTTFNVWVPEGKLTLTDSFNPEKAEWIKKGGEISFHQQDLASENVVEIEQGEE